MTVKKRNGDIEEFDTKKIERAIMAAAKSAKVEVSSEILEKLVKFVTSKVSKLTEPIEIEDIQNTIEDSLMKYNLFEVERTFHDYRKEHDKIRFKSFAINKEMEEKLAASNVQNSNANMDEASHGGRKGEMINSYLKKEALDYRINPKFSKLHENNHIYEHDLDSWSLGMHNCLSIPFDDFMEDGIITRQVFIRPAKSIATFCQLIAVGKQLQSLQQFGGVAATHIDSSAVMFIRYSLMKHYIIAWLKDTGAFEELNLIQMAMDDYQDEADIWHNRLEDWIDDRKDAFLKETGLVFKDFYIGNEALEKKYYQSALLDTIKEIKQAIEAMLHNLNSLQSRSGNQLPFSSINYGLDTTEEGRLFTSAILHNTIRGVGNGMTSIFPCQIFQLKEGVNTKPGDPNYDLFKLAVRSSAKRMYPNYVNCDWSVQKAAFEKSQALKEKVLLKIAQCEPEFFKDLAKLPYEIQEKLGFHIEDDGSDEISVEYR
jgi:ribonucleoside-triphosphate reductase